MSGNSKNNNNMNTFNLKAVLAGAKIKMRDGRPLVFCYVSGKSVWCRSPNEQFPSAWSIDGKWSKETNHHESPADIVMQDNCQLSLF